MQVLLRHSLFFGVSKIIVQTVHNSGNRLKSVYNINGFNSCTVTVHKQLCCTQLYKLGRTILNKKIENQLSQISGRTGTDRLNPLLGLQVAEI